ncbi:MAG: GtrA family protein [Henriciella sp.]|nr:GtrA family protein [Henriciella sp.]
MNKHLPTLIRLFRFGVIGVLATIVHAAILWILVETAGLRPSIATIFAFLGALNVSYFGHYYFTFRSTEPHRRALPGFVLTAVVGAFLTWLFFVIATEILSWHYWIAFGITIVLVPLFVFFVSRRVAFERPDRSDQT